MGTSYTRTINPHNDSGDPQTQRIEVAVSMIIRFPLDVSYTGLTTLFGSVELASREMSHIGSLVKACLTTGMAVSGRSHSHVPLNLCVRPDSHSMQTGLENPCYNTCEALYTSTRHNLTLEKVQRVKSGEKGPKKPKSRKSKRCENDDKKRRRYGMEGGALMGCACRIGWKKGDIGQMQSKCDG